jgi:hypothetical protein
MRALLLLLLIFAETFNPSGRGDVLGVDGSGQLKGRSDPDFVGSLRCSRMPLKNLEAAQQVPTKLLASPHPPIPNLEGMMKDLDVLSSFRT